MNKGLLIDLYELTMAQAYFKHKRDAFATFDLFVRSSNRPFYIACGIDEALNYLHDLRFTKEDIDYLRELALFEDDFLDYLREFKFKGEVWAMEEPEIAFPQEPILRVSGNLLEAQIVESALLNKINLATTLATKALRVVLAAKGKDIYDFSLRRTQGQDASLAIAKYSYIVGAKGTSNVLAGFLYKIPVAGTMAHSYVMSFDREIESFLAFTQAFPTKSIILVDTYEVKQGIDSAVRVAKFLKKEGVELLGIRLDSGDISEDSKYARKILDEEGLIDTFIVASGNLDEHKIEKLIEAKSPIDAFGVGTNMGCSSDLAYTDVIYKLVEIKEKGKDFIPTMKLSKGKSTLPSKKQVFRVFDKSGIMEKDVIVLDRESAKGKKVLKKLMQSGNIIYKEKSVNEKRKIFEEKIAKLPNSLKDIRSGYVYPVAISKGLAAFTERLRCQLVKRVSRKLMFMDIDTQYDFLNKNGALYVKDSEQILDNLKKLKEFARKNSILVVSSHDTHIKDDPEFKYFPPHCVTGSGGHKKIKETIFSKFKVLTFKKIYSKEELKTAVANYQQIILEKNIINIFSNPNALNLLEVVFPDKVYVYGVVTEYCVKEAVDGLIKNGFSIGIVEDAIKEISLKEKEKLFSLWKKRGVEFITTENLLKSLNE
jgi:nicotinate phosphoribosyltransferase